MKNLVFLTFAFLMLFDNSLSQNWVSMNGPWKANTNDLSIGIIDELTLRIYAADSIGLYFSENGGNSWNKNNTLAPIPIRVDCRKDDARYILVAADDNYIHWSTDGGSEWDRYQESDIAFPFRIAISPSNPYVAYIAMANSNTRSSLWKTTDFGRTWDQIPYFYTSVYGHIRDILFDPEDENKVWVCGKKNSEELGVEDEDYGEEDANSGVWYTEDGGDSWEQRNNRLTISHLTALGRKYDPGEDIEWIFTGGKKRAFRSSDRGLNWEEISDNLEYADTIRAIVSGSNVESEVYAVTDRGIYLNRGVYWEIYKGTFHEYIYDYDMTDLVINPRNESIMYLSNSASIFKTTNGGFLWRSSCTGIEIKNTTSVSATNGNLLSGNFREDATSSYDGSIWQNYPITYQFATEFPIIDIRNVSLHPKIPGLGFAIGYKDRKAVVYRKSNIFTFSQGWSCREEGNTSSDFYGISFDPIFNNNDDNVTFVYGKSYRSDLEGEYFNLFRSTNSGMTFGPIKVKPTNVSTVEPIKSVVIDSSGSTGFSKIIYAGIPTGSTDEKKGVWKTTDGGESWSNIFPDRKIQALALNTHLPSTIYAGGVKTVDTSMWRSTNRGVSWKPIIGRADTIRKIIMHPYYPNSNNRLWIVSRKTNGTSDSIYYTFDAGTTWKNVTGNLSKKIKDLSPDPIDKRTLYAATDGGIFKYDIPIADEIQRTASYQPDWNMISIPVIVYDFSKTAVYPEAIGDVSAYENGYVPKDMLTIGIGYWTKFPPNLNKTYTGDIIPNLAVPVRNNWNIVGTISSPVLVNTITTEPPGIRKTNFFKYDKYAGYVAVETLLPGIGYWVQFSQNGIMNLNSGGSSSSQPEIQHLETADKFIVVDSENNERTLYICNSEMSIGNIFENVEMPPPPPDALFDARFSTGDIIRTVNPESGIVELSIDIDATAYPCSLIWEINPENGIDYSITLQSGGLGKGSFKKKIVQTGTIVLNDKSESKIFLEGKAEKTLINKILPNSHNLHQNYPNPFNPVTLINYELPSDSWVTVKVYDVLGREVATLVDDYKSAGYYDVSWDASSMPSGVYIYKLTAGSFTDVKKMLLMK